MKNCMAVKFTILSFIFRAVIDLSFTQGFAVLVGNRCVKPWTVSTLGSRKSMVSTVSIPAGEACDCENDEAPVDDFLLFPSSCPSKAYAASNVRVCHKQIETEHGDDGMEFLPMQRYHARSAQRRDVAIERVRREEGTMTSEKPQQVVHDIPSLDYIYENQSRFQITKSSQVLLEEYQTLKSSYRKNCTSSASSFEGSVAQQSSKRVIALKGDRLRSKIRAECRASLQLSVKETLKIIYCDSHICVVDKPGGVLSVPGHRRNPSLANLVYDTVQPSSYDTDCSIENIDQTVVHRLDMATSGIIVYALSKEALQRLHVTFRDRTIQKTYQALVEGHVQSSQNDGNTNQETSLFGSYTTMEGEIDVALERDPDNPPYMRIAQTRPNRTDSDTEKQHKFWREAPKPSKTTWSVLSYEFDTDGRPVTRLELRPHTGRTHQLRVHTSQVLGAPIVGDEIYGNGDGKSPLCLHARQLCLKHPVSGAPMIFEADPPF